MKFKVEGQCPNCAKEGATIAFNHVKHHVDDITFLRDEFEYYVCKNSECDVVYFSIVSQFLTAQLNKEIGYKKSSSKEALVCYCYNIKKSELSQYTTDIVETKMQEYPCACDTRNPYSKCCLSQIKKLQKSSFEQ